MAGQERNEMPHMSLQEIADACGGTYIGSNEDRATMITGVVRDNRDVQPGNLFVAIEGERVDGHSFVEDAFARGAACALVQKVPGQFGKEPGKHAVSLESEEESNDLRIVGGQCHTSLTDGSESSTCMNVQENQGGISGSCILVKSTTDAMKKLAAYYRNSLDIRVVGVTGSVGKTSTKEMIASVLSQKYNVLKTEGNYNNEIGLPLTIFRIRSEHQVAVLEMGISDFGEMHRLAAMAQPDIGVITNIGLCHLENLGTREGILNAKTEMFDHMRDGGVAILNGDDDKLVTREIINGSPAIFYGIDEGTLVNKQVCATDIEDLGFEGMSARFHTPQGDFTARIPIPGEHNVYNALAATAVGLELGLTLEEISAGIEAAETIEGRMHFIHSGGMTIIDDCYNANPVSMKAGLSLLSKAKGRSIAVLGDMGELGEDERRLHCEVGEFAGKQNITTIFAAGQLSQEYIHGIKRVSPDREVHYYTDRDSMTAALLTYVQPGDSILVKASHFMEFSKVVKALCEK